ncbi:hypothetical protein B188_01890 [Candidatus Brocadiaceae bacterium B188]|jgi:hypothetical protein|nr:hypothetical protein B188_01890 [Candidatus Brocadiaceae bacterium B188]
MEGDGAMGFILLHGTKKTQCSQNPSRVERETGDKLLII